MVEAIISQSRKESFKQTKTGHVQEDRFPQNFHARAQVAAALRIARLNKTSCVSQDLVNIFRDGSFIILDVAKWGCMEFVGPRGNYEIKPR